MLTPFPEGLAPQLCVANRRRKFKRFYPSSSTLARDCTRCIWACAHGTHAARARLFGGRTESTFREEGYVSNPAPLFSGQCFLSGRAAAILEAREYRQPRLKQSRTPSRARRWRLDVYKRQALSCGSLLRAWRRKKSWRFFRLINVMRRKATFSAGRCPPNNSPSCSKAAYQKCCCLPGQVGTDLSFPTWREMKTDSFVNRKMQHPTGSAALAFPVLDVIKLLQQRQGG